MRKRTAKDILTIGDRGYRVTLCRRYRSRLSLRWWDPTIRNYRWKSLKHNDEELGERQAKELAGQLLATGTAPARGTLPIAGLLGRYEREVSAYKKGAGLKEDRRRMELWQAFLGSDRDVTALDIATMNRFVRERAAGTIAVPDRELRAGVSGTTIGADLVFLQAVLNWATKVRLADGTRLLSENPLRGYPLPRTKNPRRPFTTFDRHKKLLAVADQVDRRQRLFGAFLELIESLGWRVTAVCELRASDVDRTPRPKTAPWGRIRKRGDVDKEGVDMWLPLSKPARRAIDRVLARNAVIGDRPLFPSPRKPERPWTRFHARDLYERAEKRAKLEPLEGSDFHAYRRKWATERKHLPDTDVMEAGGWKDPRSFKGAYQQVDEATLLAVVSEPLQGEGRLLLSPLHD